MVLFLVLTTSCKRRFSFVSVLHILTKVTYGGGNMWSTKMCHKCPPYWWLSLLLCLRYWVGRFKTVHLVSAIGMGPVRREAGRRSPPVPRRLWTVSKLALTMKHIQPRSGKETRRPVTLKNNCFMPDNIARLEIIISYHCCCCIAHFPT